MANEDHPIYKHVQHDARARAQRGGAASVPREPAGSATVPPPLGRPSAVVSPPPRLDAEAQSNAPVGRLPQVGAPAPPAIPGEGPAPLITPGPIESASGLADLNGARPGRMRRLLGAVLGPYGRGSAQGRGPSPRR